MVHVAPSSQAPHMVDGRYLGRGEKTKRYLTDPEVLRAHTARGSAESETAASVLREFDRDPVEVHVRTQAHMFLVAEPLAGRPEILLDLVDGEGWKQRLFHLRQRVIEDSQPALDAALVRGCSPDFATLGGPQRRPQGAALAYRLTPGRQPLEDRGASESIAEVEISEHGGLRVYTSRLSDHLPSQDVLSDERYQLLFEDVAVIYARRFLSLTKLVSEHASYYGVWALGIGANGLSGASSHLLWRQDHDIGHRYGEDVYQRATSAAYGELLNQPGQVANRLVGGLLRAYGTRDAFAAALS